MVATLGETLEGRKDWGNKRWQEIAWKKLKQENRIEEKNKGWQMTKKSLESWDLNV